MWSIPAIIEASTVLEPMSGQNMKPANIAPIKDEWASKNFHNMEKDQNYVKEVHFVKFSKSY